MKYFMHFIHYSLIYDTFIYVKYVIFYFSYMFSIYDVVIYCTIQYQCDHIGSYRFCILTHMFHI